MYNKIPLLLLHPLVKVGGKRPGGRELKHFSLIILVGRTPLCCVAMPVAVSNDLCTVSSSSNQIIGSSQSESSCHHGNTATTTTKHNHQSTHRK